MTSRELRAVLLLPLNVLVSVPVLLLWGSQGWRPAAFDHPAFWLALPCFAAGIGLMASTIRLFSTEGEGTLAPWDPTKKLVIVGIYRHVRNPMISGVLLNLLGEALLFLSPWILGWFFFFLLGNSIYIPLYEEPGLEERFGDDYRRYKKSVPRWIPRWRPYEG